MRNIMRIFIDCFARLRGNIIAIVITCGLVLLPSLYTWFSLLAFWNPEGSTGNLSVAVANKDSGYQSDLLPVKIDAGSQVVDQLRANDQFDWTFVDESEAKEGVSSGKYYAAIVIPTDFSEKLTSVLSDKIENPSIQYYVNEKENPIAPHLTSIGASTLQNDINQAFTSTITEVALNTNTNLSKFMSGNGLANYAYSLVERLGSAASELQTDAQETHAFSTLLGQTRTLIDTASGALDETSKMSGEISPLIDEARAGLNETVQGTDGFTQLASEALSNARGALNRTKTAVASAFNKMKGDPAAVQGMIGSLKSDLDQTKAVYAAARDAIAKHDPSAPILKTIDQIISEVDALETRLDTASGDISQNAANAEAAYKKVSNAVDKTIASLDKIQSNYGDSLRNSASQLQEHLDALGSSAADIVNGFSATASELTSGSGKLSESISDARASLDEISSLLDESGKSLQKSHDKLQHALKTSDLDEVRRIIGNDPDSLAKALVAPTEINKHAVYAVANYGSAMSPFYTSLGLFIGSIFLVIILKIGLTPARRKALGNPTPVQEYFGNLLFFLVIVVAQALLMCTGNLFFLGIQCENIALYYLTGLVTTFVFLNVIYALVVAFGNVGKGLCVILLVLQVAGSGGELPIELSAALFQDIYPWLPFTHSMNMFQGAIAGIYGNQYLISLAVLLAYLVPALILGLALRRPILKLNDAIGEQLEKTKVL